MGEDAGVEQDGAIAVVEADDGEIAIPERKRDKAKRFALEGAKLLGVATARITTRTLWWGGWGLVLGLGTWAGVWALGWLAVPWPAAHWPMIALFGVLYAVAGAGCWGHAGFWRGVGRFALAVGVERGWVVTLLAALLDRVTAGLRRSTRVDRVLTRAELFAEDLPLARWEELMKDASTWVMGEHIPDANRLMRFLRGFVVGQIEKYTLRIVRKEVADGRGGGVSMERVREVAFEHVEEMFTDGVVGLMNKQLLLMTGAFVGLAAIPPVAVALARWWVAS